MWMFTPASLYILRSSRTLASCVLRCSASCSGVSTGWGSAGCWAGCWPGCWAAPAAPRGAKNFTAPPARPAKARIVFIDRPGSPQSVILGAQLTPIDPFGDVVPVSSANDVLGGNFLSRINMDLRETKGWSYGVRGSIGLNVQAVPYLISAPVQADRTADSIKALNSAGPH